MSETDTEYPDADLMFPQDSFRVKKEEPAFVPTVESIEKERLEGHVERMLPNVWQSFFGDLRTLAESHLQENEIRLNDGHTPKDNKVDKDTNPKDVIGANKLPLSIVPGTLIIYAALGFLEGALKYGRFNWRIAGARSSIYIDALKRHIEKYESGEDVDPATGVHHFSNMAACVGILADAKECGKLIDDRPPRAPLARLIDRFAGEVVRLKELFKSHHPHQYTIKDGDQ